MSTHVLTHTFRSEIRDYFMKSPLGPDKGHTTFLLERQTYVNCPTAEEIIYLRPLANKLILSNDFEDWVRETDHRTDIGKVL